MVWIGTVSAILAAALGLILVNQEDYAGQGVTVHQWSGLATMSLAILTVLALRSGRIPAYRTLLMLTVVGVSVAGHFGALLTHGEDYLSSVLPFGNSPASPGTSGTNFAFVSVGAGSVALRQTG